MAAGAASLAPSAPSPSAERVAPRATATTDPAWLRIGLIAVACAFLALFIVVPLAFVFVQAFARGISAYVAAITQPETVSAAALTMTTAAVSVPFNTVAGLAAAWLIAKFEFRGKGLLLTIFDLPFSVSPVVSGLVFVLLLGRRGLFGPWLSEHDIKIIFAVPGVILATTFVTFPFVVREVLPVLEATGSAEEESAITLGAKPWTMFFRVTLPKIRWGLLYGVILCNARAMGEFGAVSVVSGHVRGETNTLPLHAEILFNEYDTVGAFAVASLLTVLALVTLVVKKVIEWRHAA